MAVARPTIFAGSTSNNPIAEAGAGITVEPGDPEAIAQGLLELLAMQPEERWKMGLRGREYVEKHHEFGLLAQRLEEVIGSVTPGWEKDGQTLSADPTVVV